MEHNLEKAKIIRNGNLNLKPLFNGHYESRLNNKREFNNKEASLLFVSLNKVCDDILMKMNKYQFYRMNRAITDNMKSKISELIGKITIIRVRFNKK